MAMARPYRAAGESTSPQPLSSSQANGSVRLGAADQLSAYRETAHRVRELRTKLLRILHSDILDFKRVSVENVLACCETLLLCMRNVADNPTDPKYRKIDAANTAWTNKVKVVPASEKFMVAMGWRSEVVDFQRSWVFSAPPGSLALKMPNIAVQLLEEAVGQLKHKLKLMLKTDPKVEEAAIRELTLMRIAEDRQRQPGAGRRVG